MQINPLKHLLADFRPKPEHQPSLPAPAKTPASENGKVVSIPTRAPINKQAALLISPMRCWLSKPLPPDKPPNPYKEELDSARAELKIERNDHAETRDKLGLARQKNRELQAQLLSLNQTIESLRSELNTKDGIIQQLEDLKL